MDWVSLASDLGVDQLVVGTELAGTLEHEGEWRTLIATVRAAFEGELVYAASWDEAPMVPFWDAGSSANRGSASIPARNSPLGSRLAATNTTSAVS